jgi:uncharacterized protein YdbL (DUF1318 family)
MRKMMEMHQSRDAGGDGDGGQGNAMQERIDALSREAQATREFLSAAQPRRNKRGQELKSNVTDNDSARMATGKGVIQVRREGYAFEPLDGKWGAKAVALYLDDQLTALQ